MVSNRDIIVATSRLLDRVEKLCLLMLFIIVIWMVLENSKGEYWLGKGTRLRASEFKAEIELGLKRYVQVLSRVEHKRIGSTNKWTRQASSSFIC